MGIGFERVTEVDVFDEILTDLEKVQLPFALALSCTRIADRARQVIAEQAAKVFDKPKPSTTDPTSKGPMFLKIATKSNLEAEVRVKDRPQTKGDPALAYLSHAIRGGARIQKRSEFLLERAGILPKGFYFVPGSGARIDKYGNISNGQIQEILAITGASRDASTRSTRVNAAGRASRSFFALNQKYFVASKTREATRGIPEGVWQRVPGRGGIVPVLIFVARVPIYSKRLRFFEIQMEVAKNEGANIFREAMFDAITTAVALV